MDIAVVGCGITGTAVACFLARNGHRVTIFEQAQQSLAIGAGIMLQPSGQTVLRELSILERVESVSAKLSGMTAKLISGKNLVELQYSKLDPSYHALGVHRGRLFQCLMETCQSHDVTIRNGCKVTGFEHVSANGSTRLQINFDDESRIDGDDRFDCLIGADGIRSAVRQHLVDQKQIKSRLHQYEHAALWMTTKTDYKSDQLFQFVEGTQKLIGLLPIGQSECSFFWGLLASEYDQLRARPFDEWKSTVIKHCPDAEFLIADKTGFDQFTFGKYGHVVANRSYADRVILLGDAAHATSPHLGQGANLGLEDALIFAQALHKSGDFNAACRLYARQQARKIRYYQRLTRFLSPFFQSNGWIRGRLRDLFLPWLPHLPIVGKQMLRTLCGFKRGWLG